MKDKYGRTFVPDTPDTGRSKRRSTMLSSVATNSLIFQQQKFDSPDNTVQFKERTVVEETPEPAIQFTEKAETGKSKSSRKARPLPSLLPSEVTFVQQSQDIFSSTINPDPSPTQHQGGGSSSRRKKGKPFKIVQWNQDENPSFIDDTYLENAQNSVLENSQNLLALSDSVSGENSSDQLVTDSRTIRLKTAEEAKKEESRRILEESHISEHLEDSSTKSKKNRRLSLSKNKRLSATPRDFVKYILAKEKTPPPAKPGDASVGMSDSDDDWEVITNEDGSIKKYLPKSNRKSLVISGNIKSKTKDRLGGLNPSTKPPPKSRKNLSKDLSGGAPVKERGRANSTLVSTSSRRSNRMSSVSQLSDVPEVFSNSEELSLAASKTPPDISDKVNGSDVTAPVAAVSAAAADGTGSSTISVSGAAYSGLSFQNFSSESAKDALNQLGNGGWNSDLARKLADKPRRGRPRRSDISSNQTLPSQLSNNSRITAHSNTSLPSSNQSSKLTVNGKLSTNQSQAIEPMSTNSSTASKPNLPSHMGGKKRKLSIEEDRSEKKSKMDDSREIPSTPQRIKPVFSRPGLLRENKTSFSPLPMDLCDSPTRRSGRPSTKISTLASDGLTKSPSVNSVASPLRPSHQMSKGESDSNKLSTSLVSQDNEQSESPTRRSGRKSTQICTLASDGLSKSPSLGSNPIGQPKTSKIGLSSLFRVPSPRPILNPDPGIPSSGPLLNPDPNQSVDDIPLTQAAPLFEGMVFFVELRDGRDNRSLACQNRVRKFGGMVEDKIGRKVTHIIFQGGTKANYLKAKKLNVPLLSVLWVEESITQGAIQPINKYPSINCEDYAKGKFPSLRKLKSMQIRTMDEAVKFGEEKRARKEKRLEKEKKKEKERKQALEKNKVQLFEPLYYEGSPYIEKNKKKEKDDPLSKIMNELKSPSGSPLRKEYFKAPSTPIWDDEEEMNLSLADRLIHRYKKNKALANQSASSTPGGEACTPTTKEGDGSILLSTPLGDGQDTPRGPGRSPAVNISSRSSTVIGDTPSKNVTQSSSLDTTTKPRKALKMADSTLKDSPVLSKSRLIDAVDGSFIHKRRSGRASTQLCTKASAVLEMQDNSPVKPYLQPSADNPPPLDDNNPPPLEVQHKPLEVAQPSTKPKEPLKASTGRKPGAKRGRPKKPKNIEAELESAERNGFGSPNLESTRLSCFQHETSRISDLPKESNTGTSLSKDSNNRTSSLNPKSNRTPVLPKETNKRTTGHSNVSNRTPVLPKETNKRTTVLSNVSNRTPSLPKDSIRPPTSHHKSSGPSTKEVTTPLNNATKKSAEQNQDSGEAAKSPLDTENDLKSPVDVENDRLFDALLQSSFTGRRASGPKKFVLANSSLRSEGRRTPEVSRSSPQRLSSSPRHQSSTSPRHHSHSSSARQWLSLAVPHNKPRSPQRSTPPGSRTSVPLPTNRPSPVLSTKPACISSQPNKPSPKASQPSKPTSQLIKPSNKPSDTPLRVETSNQPSQSSPGADKTIVSSPVTEMKSPKSRVVAPWRNQTAAGAGEASLPQDQTCDIYEFDGFPDEPKPGTANHTSPTKKKQIRVSRPATKFGLPGDHKMFLVAPKRKPEASPAKQRDQSPASRERSPLRSVDATPKSPPRVPKLVEDISQLSPILSKHRRHESPVESRATSPTFQNSSRRLQTSHSMRRDESPSADAPRETSVPPQEPRKVEKKKVLSKIFQKPKEQDSSASSDKSKAGSRTSRRTSRDQPPPKSSNKERNNSNRDKMSDRKEPRTAKKHKLFSQNMLEETARNSPGTAGANAYEDVYPVKQSHSASSKPTFKVPRKKRTKAGGTESDGSVTSETDSQSSNQSDTDGRKKKSTGSKRPPRRSSMDFAPLPRFIQKMEERRSGNTSKETTGSKSRRKGAGSSKNIVCTSCSQDDISLVNQLINTYNRFSFSTTVNSRTSHVVSGEGKRTLNLLKGLLQGCWIVTKEWALASLESGRWVDEEPYEMVDFSPAVKNLRVERSTWGSAFRSELFKEIGTIYISAECRAPRDELRQLVQAGGGLVSHQARIAQVVVGEEHPDPAVHQVTEKWILDSVQFNVIMPFSDYPM